MTQSLIMEQANSNLVRLNLRKEIREGNQIEAYILLNKDRNAMEKRRLKFNQSVFLKVEKEQAFNLMRKILTSLVDKDVFDNLINKPFSKNEPSITFSPKYGNPIKNPADGKKLDYRMLIYHKDFENTASSNNKNKNNKIPLEIAAKYKLEKLGAYIEASDCYEKPKRNIEIEYVNTENKDFLDRWCINIHIEYKDDSKAKPSRHNVFDENSFFDSLKTIFEKFSNNYNTNAKYEKMNLKNFDENQYGYELHCQSIVVYINYLENTLLSELEELEERAQITNNTNFINTILEKLSKNHKELEELNKKLFETKLDYQNFKNLRDQIRQTSSQVRDQFLKYRMELKERIIKLKTDDGKNVPKFKGQDTNTKDFEPTMENLFKEVKGLSERSQ